MLAPHVSHALLHLRICTDYSIKSNFVSLYQPPINMHNEIYCIGPIIIRKGSAIHKRYFLKVQGAIDLKNHWTNARLVCIYYAYFMCAESKFKKKKKKRYKTSKPVFVFVLFLFFSLKSQNWCVVRTWCLMRGLTFLCGHPCVCEVQINRFISILSKFNQ